MQGHVMNQDFNYHENIEVNVFCTSQPYHSTVAFLGFQTNNYYVIDYFKHCHTSIFDLRHHWQTSFSPE